jgi:hypothetical protein
MNRLLAGVASSFLALILCTTPMQAESPVRTVTLAYEFDIDPANPLAWAGTMTLTIDGVEYTGEGVWWITYATVINGRVINDNNVHYFATGIYDFPGLGSFEIWENGILNWGIIEPDYRLSTWRGVNQIVSGTGAFASAHGTLHYLRAEIEAVGSEPPVANALLRGQIYGIELGD